MHSPLLRRPRPPRTAPGVAALTVGVLVAGLLTGPAAVAAPDAPAASAASGAAPTPAATSAPVLADATVTPPAAAPTDAPTDLTGTPAVGAAPSGTPAVVDAVPAAEPSDVFRFTWDSALKGRAVVGQTLSVAAPVVDGGAQVRYQWYRGDSEVVGDGGRDYRTAPEDAGETVTVQVTLTRAGTEALVLTSQAVEVRRATFTATPTPALTGTAKVGHRLTATPGSWSPSGATLSYQWYRGSTPIARATGRTYVLGAADSGKYVKVRIRAAKPGYTTGERWSVARKVAAGSITATKPLKVGGTARYGRTVRASHAWTPGVSARYQWYRNGRAISGATRSELRLGHRDVGARISLRVTVSKAGYTARKVFSPAVTVGRAYITTKSSPRITGLKKAGSTLTASAGSYSPRPASYGYQWYRNGRAIAGATHRGYRLVSADNGKRISVRVWARKAYHHTRVATSGSVTIPWPPRTVVSGDGTYRVGTTLKPGLYKATGTGGSCYWKRISGFSGSFDEIIENYFGSARTYVQIRPGDRGFETSRCGQWKTVSGSGAYASRITADGTYRVGIDIRPGTYRSSGSGSSCYWKTMSGFSGDFDEILENYFGSARTYVTIPAGAKGFEVSRCGTLVRVGS